MLTDYQDRYKQEAKMLRVINQGITDWPFVKRFAETLFLRTLTEKKRFSRS